MNIYIYPKEIVGIEGKPETKVPATANLPAATCQPRVSIEFNHGTMELTLTLELALQLSIALCNAFPAFKSVCEPISGALADAYTARYADQHAAEFATKA